MKEIFASAYAGTFGLLFFFIFFCAILIWVFRPGSKQGYEEDARIPLKEREDDERQE